MADYDANRIEYRIIDISDTEGCICGKSRILPANASVNPELSDSPDLLDGMRCIRTAIEWDYWEISRKAQERAGLTPIIPSYMQEARND